MAEQRFARPELRNPVWASLVGPLAHVARPGPAGRAAAFEDGFGVFVGLDDPEDPDAWADATGLLDDGVGCFFFPDPVTPPVGWKLLTHIPASQLAAPENLTTDVGEPILELGPEDHPDIFELAKLAEPGPFDVRSAELGRFVGVRDGDRLVAMAGERLRSESTVEISAVAVHPEARRRGLGAATTAAIGAAAQRRGQLPYLHVLGSNDGAARLYEAMGFELVQEMTVTVFEREA